MTGLTVCCCFELINIYVITVSTYIINIFLTYFCCRRKMADGTSLTIVNSGKC
jgi:hypothetical protein